MKYVKSGVSHADLSTSDDARTFLQDYAEAKDNLAAQHMAGHGMKSYLAERVAHLMETERSRRNAHYWRYCAMFKIASGQRLFEDADNLAEASLLDLNHRVKGMSDADYAFARSLDGKGISAELGHIDQLGDWQSAKLLDAQVRELPESKRLAEEDFVFGETYDSKDEAKINYRFYVSSHGHRQLNLKGVRKRAAADVLTDDGNVFEIVKQSTFLIDGASLSKAQQQTVEQMLRSQQLKAARTADGKPDVEEVQRIKAMQAETMNDAGRAIIEPFIIEPKLRERSTAVVAVTSLYFALHRHR